MVGLSVYDPEPPSTISIGVEIAALTVDKGCLP